MKVTIVTSGHWDGDPRLNRHVRYLREAGFEAELRTFASGNRGRISKAFGALAAITNTNSDIVLLPDPELFVAGSIAARFRGIHPVIDIHEDYPKAVTSRAWIPVLLRPIARLLARTNDWLGRKIAGATMVAAEELATPGAHVVLNIPNPDDFDGSGNHLEIIQAVYVGDVTAERGALEIADLARRLPGIHFLVIGRADADLFREMTSRSGNSPNLELVGRLEHKDAWERARGSIAGLSLLRPLPAYSEAIATKLWEYAAAGIPPVVTDLPGQNRFVSAVDSSLAGQSLDDLAGIIQRLAEDEEFRARVTETARAVVVEHWSDSRPDLAVVRAVSLSQS